VTDGRCVLPAAVVDSRAAGADASRTRLQRPPAAAPASADSPDPDWLVDSEVSELLRCRSPAAEYRSSPCGRRLRRRDPSQPATAAAAVARSPPARPSLDFYKMQVGRQQGVLYIMYVHLKSNYH